MVRTDTEVRTVWDQSKTPKGLEWQVNQLTAEFKSRISKWRKNACSLELLIADSNDVTALRKNRDIISSIMYDMDAILQRMNISVTDREDVILRDYKEEFQGRHEVIEADHHSLLKQITDWIRNLKYKASAQSSRSYRRSVGEGSMISRESTNTVEAAALKTKLKYIHAEAELKVELEKIQTSKELDIPPSKISALEGLDGATAHLMSCSLQDIPKIDMLEMHLKNQQDEQVKTESVDSNVYMQVPPVQPSMKYGTEPLPRTSVSMILPATGVHLNHNSPGWTTDNTRSVHPSRNNVTQ